MDVRMPDGTIVTNVPDNITQEALLSAYSSYAPEPVSENPIYGVAANVTPSLATGIGSLLQMPGKAADLLTGTAPGEQAGFLRNLVGVAIPGGMKTVQEAGASLEEVGKAAKTLGLQQKEKERAQKIADTEGQLNKLGVAFSETLTDPTLISSFIVEQLPNAFGAGVGGLIAKNAGRLLFKNASEKALASMGVSGTVATGAAMQGADIGYETYKDIYERLVSEGMDATQANVIAAQKGRVAALEAGGLSYAVSKIPGAREFEKALFKQTRQAIPKAGLTGTLKGGAKGALGEGTGELIEETGGQFASNIGKQEVFPETELLSGTGEAGAMALLGGMGMGGLGGAINARSQANAQKRQEVEAAQQAEEKRNAAIAEALKDVNQDLTSPIVATMTTTIDGKDSVKTTRADGSVYVDGVMVEPPRQETEAPEVFYSEQPLPQEILDQGYKLVDQREEDGQIYYAYTKEEPQQVQSAPSVPPDTDGLNDGDLEMLAQVKESQPLQFTDPDTGATIVISLAKLNNPALKAGEEVVYGGKTYYTYVQIPPKDAAGQLDLAPAEDVILQNRNRNNPVSIAQMNKIANEPDYSRVSFSNSFTEGAPVIFGSQSLPSTQLGRRGTVVAGKTNRKIPVQYAVIESDQMVASNAVDGSTIPEYANPTFTGFRAVTNGRVAGLKEGYKRGTMGQYKQDLLSDDIHGISPNVISKMKNPILVRVMPQDQVTADIADESNTSSTLGLSVIEQAKNDANRIDLSALDFSEDGAISSKTARGFVAGMPQTEQRNLLVEGQPNRGAYDRLNAAIFYKAYGSEALVSLAAEAKSVDAANIINGLSQAAPQMAQLEGLGEYDIRPQVVEAAEMAVNASRQDQKISDVIAQQDLISQDSISREILQLFANNTRSAKKIGMGLRRIASDANAEASLSQEPDMLGDVQIKRPAANVVEGTAKQIIEEDIKAKQEAADKAAAAKDKAEAERKAIAAASVKASSEYVLGRSAEDDLSGQKPMFSKSIAEQKEDAELVANNFGGKVVYQNGNISLTQGRNAYGDPVYLPAKGTRFYTSSVDSVKNTSALFTKEEFQELLDARTKIEAQDAKKHVSNPFVTFKNGMATSENISAELAGIFKQWKSLLKLDQNIYLSTIEDALANKDDFAGPQRRIGNAADTLNKEGTPGSTQALADGTRYILIDQNQSPAELIEILAHEMGHAHQQEVFNNAPVALQNQIKSEFTKWLNSQKGKTAKEFVYALRAKETAETTNIPKPDMPAKDLKDYFSYWSTFSEWYADQTARWATTSEKPLTAVDKFFAKVAETLRSFFKTLQSAGFLPNATFKQYMDDITATEIVAANTFVPSNEQMPLFATKIAPLTKAPTVPSTGTPRPNVTGAPIAGTWSAAPETTLTPYIYKYQDKQVDLKDAQKQIEKTIGKIDDALNAYRKETLYYGRVADQQEQFLNKELKPLLKEIESKKLTLDEVDKYLQALHAEERNKSIAKRINGMQDGGAGIATADAKAYLASLSPDKAQDLQGIAKRVRNIIAGTQAVEVAGGLELQSKIDGWNKAWPNYVPLFRDEIDYVNPSSGMGQGFSTRGGSSKRAVGSDKPVKEIIASLSDQRQKAIVRSEKARVGKSLYALAIANPNPDYWLAIDPNSKSDIKKVEQMLLDYGFDQGDIAQLIQNMAQEPKTGSVKRVFNPVTKQFDEVVRYEINAQNRYSSNVLAIRVNGEDKFLFFNPSNDRAKRMAEAIKNLDAEQLSEGLQTVGSVTRFIASLSTQYNPIFGAFNFARDVQGAMLNLTTTPLRYKKAEVFAGSFKALKGIYAEARARRAGGQSSSYYSDLYRDFESVGGKTGFINQFSNFQKKGTIVERELKNLTKGKFKRAVSAVGGLLSDYNDMLENAVRLSAYEQGIKMNLSKEEAAEIAKNLTVNFNRKGAKTGWLGALFAFFGSAVQGTARLYETLRGPAGKKIMAGGFLLGAFQAALLTMAGFDEDEPSEFIKQKNFVIPTFDGGYVMIPMPLGFNILPNVGRIISEIAFGNKKSGTRKVGDLLEAALSSFNPLGGGNAIQVLSPTAFDPIANIILNKDSFGRPISREDRALNPTPGYLRSRESAGVVSKGIAEFINYVSGGTEFNKGAFSPTGDDINYVVSQYLGGVGREVMRAKEFVTSIGKDEPFEPYKVPILGKLYGDVNAPASIANKFYLNVKQMAEHENEVKGRKGAAISSYIRDNPEARLSKSANNLENQISKLNKTKREFIERNASEAAIRRIEDQKLRMMKQFNEQVRRLQ